MNQCDFEDISFQSVLHELPPGSPGYWGECLTTAALLHLLSTSLARCQCHFTVACSDHRNYSGFSFYSILSFSLILLSPFPVWFFSLPFFLSVLNIFSGYLLILVHTSICSWFFSGSQSQLFSPHIPISASPSSAPVSFSWVGGGCSLPKWVSVLSVNDLKLRLSLL